MAPLTVPGPPIVVDPVRVHQGLSVTVEPIPAEEPGAAREPTERPEFNGERLRLRIAVSYDTDSDARARGWTSSRTA